MSLKAWNKGTVFLITICLIMLLIIGCSESDNNYDMYTASILGTTKLVALEHIPGELNIKQLVTVTANNNKIRIDKLDRAYAFEPAPDGKTIAYVTDNGIFLTKSNGEGKVKLTELSPKFDLNTNSKKIIGKVMAWSPDGTKLAFVCGGDLYVADTAEKGKEKLVIKRSADQVIINEGSPALGPKIEGITCPDWVDNSTLIYQDFYSKYDGQFEYFYSINLVKYDGSGKRVIIENGREPVLSPNRKNILFHVRDDQGGKIKVSDINGSESTVVTGLLDADHEPMTYSWSPDGKYVLFDGFAADLASGSHIAYKGELITGSQGVKRGKSTGLPSVSPDGRWIVFSAPGGPKFLNISSEEYKYDSSPAFEPLGNLVQVSWIKE